ncbi:MAG: tRNA (adenosine(37)-N6)-threonylcarbamoyltransferase complex dimerization subunit type 1 TsaB [Patescibacteria group bacterium]
MILYINTASHDEIIIALFKTRVDFNDSPQIITRKKIRAPRRQAEKLVPAIDSLLQSAKKKLSGLKKIVVANSGGSFTSLRIGVITANALAFALKIPVEAEFSNDKKGKNFSGYSLVEPVYDREPNIGTVKK